MSRRTETAKQVHRDQMNAGFWTAVRRIDEAATHAREVGTELPGVRFKLVGELPNGQRHEVPLDVEPLDPRYRRA